jgi:hypothetical protein
MSKNYRRTWEMHNGPIPVDEKGRRYEIHHIDGDRSNNDISNLKCVTIEEHLEIHLSQGDLVEAALIAKRMRKFQTMKTLLEQAKAENKFTLQDEERFYDVHIKATEKNKGTHFYNDGTKNHRLHPDDPLTETLTKGMLKKHYIATGTEWYHDDVKCYRLQPQDPKIRTLALKKGKPEKRKYELLSDKEKVAYLERLVKKLMKD